MKLLVFFMLLAVLVFSQSSCTDQLYKEYLVNYSKPEPIDAQTWSNKKAKFCQVLNEIETTNAQNLTYTLKLSQFSDLLQEQLEEIVSAPNNPKTQGQKGPQASLQRVGANAATLDWSTMIKLNYVHNLGSCLSYWAYTVSVLYSSFLAVKGATNATLSAEYVLQCTKLYSENFLRNNRESNCKDGYIEDAGSLVKNYGIPLQATYPYQAGNWGSINSTPTTDGICETSKTVMYNADPSVTSFLYYQNVSDAELQTLLNKYPVVVKIYANTGFMNYGNGVFSGCPSFDTSYSNLNHAVFLYGYDSNGNWLIQNEWGTGWGNGGYMTLSKTNNCGISAWVYQFSSDTPYSGTTDYTITSFYGTSQNYQKNCFAMLLLAILLLIGVTL